MKIRNKKTGEIREVSVNELNQYGLGGQNNKLVKYQNKGEVRKLPGVLTREDIPGDALTSTIKREIVSAFPYLKSIGKNFIKGVSYITPDYKSQEDRELLFRRHRPVAYPSFFSAMDDVFTDYDSKIAKKIPYANKIKSALDNAGPFNVVTSKVKSTFFPEQKQPFRDKEGDYEASEEAWRMSLGLPVKNKYIIPSKYRPLNETNKASKYYTLREDMYNKDLLKQKIQELKLKPGQSAFLPSFAPFVNERYMNMDDFSQVDPLQNFKIGVNKNGKMYFYDKYDFDFEPLSKVTRPYEYEFYNEFKSGGEMIKRADGSYSRRGLWDNIRANAGSGKKPTKEMLNQERKIKNQHQAAYGMEVMGNGGVPNNPGFNALPEYVQQNIINNMAVGGQKMPPELAYARFAAAGNLNQLGKYGYQDGGEKNKFNTNLKGNAFESFNYHSKLFPSLLNDAFDYDTKGFYKEIYDKYNGDLDAITKALSPNSPTQHIGTDRYKKPNHPTFSNESKYAIPIIRPGGKWGHNEEEDYDYFKATRRNIKNMNNSDGSPFNYFKRAEDYNQDGIPDVKLFFRNEQVFKQGGSVTLNTGGEKHRIYVKTTNRGEGAKGHIMVNHPTMDKGMWDTIDLTKKAGAKTIAQGVAATKKWHRENPYKKQEGGGITLPNDFNKFQQFNKTLPKNLRDDNFKYGNYSHYDLYGMWDAAGKPNSFDDVKDSENFRLQEDGTYHGFSVGNDGVWLKPKSHPSAFMEYMQGQLNPDPYFLHNHVIQKEDGRLQYVPNNYITKQSLEQKNETDIPQNINPKFMYFAPPSVFANGGGIPERYRNMGFTSVGAKKQSTRPGKKWMVLAKKGDQYKVVHGGYKGMQDFKQHHSEQRKENFWNRMGGRNSSKATDPFSPLYWHKRFGTWEYGGQPMAIGGQNMMNPIVKKDNRNWLEYLKN